MILVINSGSSSIKVACFSLNEFSRIFSLQVTGIGDSDAKLGYSGSDPHDSQSEKIKCPDHETAFTLVWDKLEKLIDSRNSIFAIGHRVPHGGDEFLQATLIDDNIEKTIDKLSILAPLHNPPSLYGIRAARNRFRDCPHIAVFDTAFHASLPARAKDYALPLELVQKFNIKRYGFHGTSHKYVNERASRYLHLQANKLRIISCHLGSGCSICAVENGRSIDTSMGMTPLEGLVMGSRSGDLDPGIIIQLMREGGYGADELEQLLNKESGLRGMTGTQDMRAIELRASEGDESCRRALHLFCHRARKYLGAFAAVMGGVDAIVFTGGIGENSAYIRHRIGQRLEFLGAILSEDMNRDAKPGADADVIEISEPHSRVKILVVATDEEREIARQSSKLINDAGLAESHKPIPIAISARHVHLCEETVKQLFGRDHTLKWRQDLSQPGQFAAQETVSLVGPGGKIDEVRVLGPVRDHDQVEISRSDEFTLGIDAPIRVSGDIDNSPGIKIIGTAGSKTLRSGVICALRHIHMTPDDARKYSVTDGDLVEVEVTGNQRSLIFKEVLIRVSNNYKLEMHIDTDEGNAAELGRNAVATLISSSRQGSLLNKQS